MGRPATVAELGLEVENIRDSETECKNRLNTTLDKIDGRLSSIESKIDEKLAGVYERVYAVERNQQADRHQTDVALMARPAPVYTWAFSALTFFLGMSLTVIGLLLRG